MFYMYQLQFWCVILVFMDFQSEIYNDKDFFLEK